MNCKKARDLILTDYHDDQMDDKDRISADKHLAACPGCKKFSMVTQKTMAELFSSAEKANPPEYVWRRIKESIALEQRKKPNFAADFLEKLKYTFYIPNPALALATALMLILVFGAVTKLIVNNQETLIANKQGQIEYFNYVGAATTDVSASDETGFGTAIEEYFL